MDAIRSLDAVKTPGGTVLRALVGNLAEQDVDVIVSATNTRPHATAANRSTGAETSTVHGATLAAADEAALVEALSKHTEPISIGDVVVTRGQGLPCKHIFHLATHGTPEEEAATGLDERTVRLKALGDGITRAVDVAREHRAETLALPLLAPGSLGLPRQLAIETLVSSLWTALGEPTSLREVRIVTADDEARALIDWALSESDMEDPASIEQAGQRAAPGAGAAVAGATASTGMGAFPAGFVGSATGLLLRSLRQARRNRRRRTETASSSPESRQRTVEQLRRENARLKRELQAAHAEIRRLRALAPTERNALPRHRLALPVAYAVGLVDGELDPPTRAQNLQLALGIVLRYVGAVALAAYDAAGAPDPELNALLRSLLTGPPTGEGRWLKAAVEIAKRAPRTGEADLPWLRSLLLGRGERYSPATGRLQGLLEQRNRKAHDPGTADPAATRAWLAEAEPRWREAIRGLDDLLSRPLVHVDGLVDHAEEDDRVIYRVRWLRGDAITPVSEHVGWRSRLRKERLYLTDEEGERFLPLHPYLDYGHCDVTRTRETFAAHRIEGEVLHIATFRFAYSRAAGQSPRWLRPA